jgi:tRNA nucleotidyltransferase (CCA-adding enzyme)
LAELAKIRAFLAPHTQRAYLVGGAVRDLLRRHIEGKEIPITDLDIEVYGIEPERFDELMKELGAKGVGKSFFVYKYRADIDISLPRIESKVAPGHRGFAVRLARDEKEASVRRDFRLNALMLDIFSGRLLDFWGGVEDIKHRRIRIINAEKFKEDSLRVLRGVQFSARFGYRIDKESLAVMEQIDLSDLSKERIFWEFEKLFRGDFPHYGLYQLLRLGIDRKIFGLKFERFFTAARKMLRAVRDGERHLKKFYFLYIFANEAHKSYTLFLDALAAPREYYRAFRDQKALPKHPTERYVAAMALRFAIRDFLGNFDARIKKIARRIGVWEEKFAAVTPKELLAEGFGGEALGKQLRRRNLAAIKARFKGRE